MLEMEGTVTFGFSGVVIEGADPIEAIHEVETMNLYELLDFADDTLDVKVTRQYIGGKQR
jgi:hypothetical protein